MAKAKKEFEISLQRLQRQIRALQKGINEIRATGINDVLLYQAIRACANKHYKERYSKPIGIPIIKAVVEGLGSLKDYIFPPDEQEK